MIWTGAAFEAGAGCGAAGAGAGVLAAGFWTEAGAGSLGLAGLAAGRAAGAAAPAGWFRWATSSA